MAREPKGFRQTFYYKAINIMNEIAEEEGIDKVDGALLEDLFFKYYVGCDPNFSRYIRRLYEDTDKYSLRTLYSDMLEMEAYDISYMQKNNKTLISIIRDSIGTSKWAERSQINWECGDYIYSTRESSIDYAFNAIDAVIFHLKNNLSVYKENESFGKPWTWPVGDSRHAEILTNENYYKPGAIEQLEQRLTQIRKRLEGDITPGEAIDLILENWDYLWNYNTTYEAVEACVLLADHIADNKIIRRRLRDFSKNFKKNEK